VSLAPENRRNFPLMSTNISNPDQTDLDRLHAAARREKTEQAPGSTPVPMWVMFLAMIAAVAGGGQLGIMTGGFEFETTNPFVASRPIDPRPKGEGVEEGGDAFEIAMRRGSGSYALCGGCHQGNGQGIPGQFPPLAGSEWVTGGTERLIRVVQHGLTGAINVGGVTYNVPGGMQGFGSALSAADFANLMTFIRNSWGNQGTMVTKEMVEAVRSAESGRSSQWTEAELAPFADQNVPGEVPAGPGAE
jgi:mono/diheme cytochrome c family protein